MAGVWNACVHPPFTQIIPFFIANFLERLKHTHAFRKRLFPASPFKGPRPAGVNWGPLGAAGGRGPGPSELTGAVIYVWGFGCVDLAEAPTGNCFSFLLPSGLIFGKGGIFLPKRQISEAVCGQLKVLNNLHITHTYSTFNGGNLPERRQTVK